MMAGPCFIACTCAAWNRYDSHLRCIPHLLRRWHLLDLGLAYMACCWDNTRFTRTHTQTHTHTTVERPKQRGRGDQIAEGDRKSVQRPPGPRGPDQQGSSASLSFLHEYNYYLWKFPEVFFFLEQFEHSAFIRGKACTSSFGYEKTQLTSCKCDCNLEII